MHKLRETNAYLTITILQIAIKNIIYYIKDKNLIINGIVVTQTRISCLIKLEIL